MQMIDTVSEAVLGPVYGAGGTLSWPFILLAAHPEVQEELRSLIDLEFQGIKSFDSKLVAHIFIHRCRCKSG